jgi:endo-1,4-beta-xylanase
VQGHLSAAGFREAFDARAYRRFLRDLAERGLDVLITELDVLDDGLPAHNAVRDRAIAEATKRYLDVALEEPAVKSVMAFGLSDRYTWLQEDYPREDGAPRRPLPFDEDLRPKPMLHAMSRELGDAARRRQLWRLRRG